MANVPDYFAAVEEDWDLFARAGLRASLQSAYQALREKSDPLADPTFSSPNAPMVTGVMRWMYVDHHLERGCQMGWMPGITAHWFNLGDGGVSALELRGKYTSLTAFHLASPEAPIRDSRLRFEKRLINQMNPHFPQWENQGMESERATVQPVNLVLVHGGKKADFAFLRVYHDPEDLQQFITMSTNIIGEPSVPLAVDSEAVEESEPKLKDDPEEDSGEIAAGA